MKNTNEMATLNSTKLNAETLNTVVGGKKVDPVGPIPKYTEGQWLRKYWPTTMNWSIIEIVEVTDEYDPTRGFKYIVLTVNSRVPGLKEEWLEAEGSPWQPFDRPKPGMR